MDDETFLNQLHKYWFCVIHEERVPTGNNCWVCKIDEANVKMDEAIKAKSDSENNSGNKNAGEQI